MQGYVSIGSFITFYNPFSFLSLLSITSEVVKYNPPEGLPLTKMFHVKHDNTANHPHLFNAFDILIYS